MREREKVKDRERERVREGEKVREGEEARVRERERVRDIWQCDLWRSSQKDRGSLALFPFL